MIEIELAGLDLGRVRFAIDPLWETVSSLSVLQRPEGEAVHGRLSGLLDDVPANSLALLTELCGDPSWFPDFLLPEPVTTRFASPRDSVQRVRDADLELVERDLGVIERFLPDSPVLNMGTAHLRDAVADALGDYWDATMAPLWGRLEALAQGDIAHRSQQVATDGVLATIADLYERISLEGNVIRFDTQFERSVSTRGGLWLVPSVFRWPRIALQYATDMPVICYAARGSALVWEEARHRSGGLDRLLGASRADMLDRADLPVTTTEIAAATRLAKATVNEHLKALVDAGLMVSRRRGKQVLYERTPLGDDLLATATADRRP